MASFRSRDGVMIVTGTRIHGGPHVGPNRLFDERLVCYDPVANPAPNADVNACESEQTPEFEEYWPNL